MRKWNLVLAVLALVVLVPDLRSADPRPAPPPIRFMLHGNMTHELPSDEYLRFVEQIKPDILIMGVFDQRLYATVEPGEAKPKKPVPPLSELLDRWQQVADRLHRSGIRLVAQMELNVLSDRPLDLPHGSGWFGYYDKHWDE